MANTVQAFDTFEADRFNGVHNFSSHTFKVALLDGYSFTSSHVQLSEVISFETSGAGYTAGGAALQNLSVAFGGGFTTFDADDLLWQTATLTADGAVIYNDTHANDRLVCFIAFDPSLAPTANDLRLRFNANGIIRSSVS